MNRTMMLDFEFLKSIEVPENVKDWMVKNGTNHNKVNKSLKEVYPKKEYYFFLVYCIAYALQNPTKFGREACKRLLGRARRMRGVLETEEFENQYDPKVLS